MNATPGSWNSSAGGFRLGLSLRPGVLDPYKLATLETNASVADNATDGKFTYSEVRQLLGLNGWQGFRLYISNVTDKRTLVDFGEPVPVNVPSSAAYGRFCMASCDPAAGGYTVDVALFAFL
jgi:hypothetical protein